MVQLFTVDGVFFFLRAFSSLLPSQAPDRLTSLSHSSTQRDCVTSACLWTCSKSGWGAGGGVVLNYCLRNGAL